MAAPSPRVTARPGGVRVSVHVQPRARHPGIDGLHGDALRVRVTAAPVDGAANDAVIATIAAALGRPRGAVRVVAGHSARAKVLEIDGCDVTEVLALVHPPHSTASGD
jgi:uncharacterized protein (TIGR00251 family)